MGTPKLEIIFPSLIFPLKISIVNKFSFDNFSYFKDFSEYLPQTVYYIFNPPLFNYKQLAAHSFHKVTSNFMRAINKVSKYFQNLAKDKGKLVNM